MKLNKKFWNRALIVIVIVFLIHVTIQTQNKKEWHGPEQSVCNTANGNEDSCGSTFPTPIKSLYLGESCMDIGTLTFIPVQKDLDMCMSLGCTVGRTPITLTDGYACFGCVPDGLRAKSSDDCCSLESRFSEYKNGYDYLCITTPDDSDSRQCNAAEKPIAKIIQSMDLFKDDCKTAYNVGIFGGAFLVLIVLAAMI